MTELEISSKLQLDQNKIELEKNKSAIQMLLQVEKGEQERERTNAEMLQLEHQNKLSKDEKLLDSNIKVAETQHQLSINENQHQLEQNNKRNLSKIEQESKRQDLHHQKIESGIKISHELLMNQLKLKQKKKENNAKSVAAGK